MYRIEVLRTYTYECYAHTIEIVNKGEDTTLLNTYSIIINIMQTSQLALFHKVFAQISKSHCHTHKLTINHFSLNHKFIIKGKPSPRSEYMCVMHLICSKGSVCRLPSACFYMLTCVQCLTYSKHYS